MSREAMKLALVALEGNCTNPVADPEQAANEDAAITALRQALETEQQPVAWTAMAFARLGEVRDKMRQDDVRIVQQFLDGDYTALRQARSLTDELMDCVDRLGSEADTVDLRVWDHLLVYAPKHEKEPVAWADAIIDDLQGLFDTDGITEQDSGDALIRLSDAIAAVEDERERYTSPQKQEPVAWANSFDLQNFDMKVRTCPDLHHTVPLYTAPPKREWVGLTDEEIDECERLATFRYQRHKYSVRGQIITPADGLEWHFAGVIEAKLKEKNT